MLEADRHFQEGLAFHQGGDLARARESYARALAIMPRHFDALHLSGVIAIQSKDYRRAVALISEAIAIAPDNPAYLPAYSNRASAYRKLGQLQSALNDFDRVIGGGKAGADVYFNRANTQFELQRYDDAATSYGIAATLNPADADTHNSLGITLSLLDRHEEAVASYQAALRLRPDHAAAYNNLGLVFSALKRTTDALDSFAKALALVPTYADALYNRATALLALGRHAEAVSDFDRLMTINPSYPFAAGQRLHAKMYICDWRNVDAETEALAAAVAQDKLVTPSWLFSALVDAPALQRRAAEAWTRARHPLNPALGPIPAYPRHPKIRVGYYSTDFYSHATAFVLAEFFELHDRDRFEIIAFDFGPGQKDAVQTRLAKAFDRFIDVRALSDKDIAALSRSLEIDIAVDLKGYTTGYRAGIFAHRAAPLQVNYMGTAGTLGSPAIDYIVADKTVIPPSSRAHFTEKVVHLPHCYYINDRKRPLDETTPSRAALGLPERGFVFSCFNNNFKITPAVFATWMRILKRVPDSVLWLFEDNAAAADNLRREAAVRDVAPSRLVFAKRIPPGAHLARHRAVDLLLDTLPYNAHTTAIDALWTGVPVLTRPGNGFAARVAASLLHALDVPELITATERDYEDLAVSLANDPQRLTAMKDKIIRNRTTAPLFDTARFTRGMEAAFLQMYERHHAGQAPAHIEVGED